MPPLETRDRHQKAVLWAFAGYDAAGEVRVDPPVEITVRWEDMLSQPRAKVMAPDGNLVTVIANVVVDRDIAVGSIMWLGKLADFTDNGSRVLREVIIYNETPDIKGRNIRRVVGLGFYQGSLPEVVVG